MYSHIGRTFRSEEGKPMTPATLHSYEIRFDVVGACREEYERWLAENSLRWVSHEAVTSFQIWHNSEGVSPEVRLVFDFQSIGKWDSFVNSNVHKAAKEALREVTVGLDTQLWERSSIQLSQDTEDAAIAPSPCDELPPVS